MKCANCGSSAFDRMLHRVNPIGHTGIFWCMPCIEDKEPELAKNIEEDRTQIEKDIEDICLEKHFTIRQARGEWIVVPDLRAVVLPGDIRRMSFPEAQKEARKQNSES